MDEESSTIASAVVVPEPTTERGSASPPQSRKRRQSSGSDVERKRPRIDTENVHREATDYTPSTAVTETTTLATPVTAGPDQSQPGGDRRRSDAPSKDEERKRGKRLFGALLGTLSQSSSSSAQKRRADIDRKQQEKLQKQAEEFDEQQRKKLDDVVAARREQQKVYEVEAMRTRHASILATANFLQTRSEPKLYFKPWDLRQDEKEVIEKQLQEAQAQVDAELAESGLSKEEADPRQTTTEAQVDGVADSIEGQPSNTVGTNKEGAPSLPTSHTDEPTNLDTDETPTEPLREPDAIDAAKENVEENEELFEAGEDPVIY